MLGALDTLQTMKRLKEAGFNEAQAEAMTEVLRESREGTIADLATKADIAELKSEIAGVRSEMALLRQEVEAKLASLEARIAGSEAKFESKLEILRRDMTIRLGSMLVVMTGTLLAAKLFG
ncbi:MAG TPA: coiled-coil domain-containing protein [Stellaceae bacterium]|nr:coiled-coil domain-containing protein [Stellaceae bacterium]